MARKFLYLIAAIILLILAGGVAYQLNPGWFGRVAFVPSADFKPQGAPAPNAYDDLASWLARPGVEPDLSAWRPTPVTSAPLSPDSAEAQAGDAFVAGGSAAASSDLSSIGDAAIFFIHPTSYYSRESWNAPLDDRDANHRAALFVRGMASAFGDAGEIWAPRYRQATLGAFLATDRVTAGKAIDAAYQDVAQAFDAFVAAQPKNKPIILVGHSQGALHLTTLLKNKIAGTALAKRVVAAYVIGWPISLDTDMAAFGLPACQTPDQDHCILSWLSFAEPADPSMVLNAYDSTIGNDGSPRRGTRMLCTNPLTGTPDTAADADANLGTLKPNQGFTKGELIAAKVGARCDDDRGLLMVGNASDVSQYVVSGYVLPGNNYHVYDITLFWANVRADVLRRLASFEKTKGKS